MLDCPASGGRLAFMQERGRGDLEEGLDVLPECLGVEVTARNISSSWVPAFLVNITVLGQESSHPATWTVPTRS